MRRNTNFHRDWHGRQVESPHHQPWVAKCKIKPNKVGIKPQTEDKTAQLCWDKTPQTEDINSPKILGPNLKQDIKSPKNIETKTSPRGYKKPKHSGTNAIETQQCRDKKPLHLIYNGRQKALTKAIYHLNEIIMTLFSVSFAQLSLPLMLKDIKGVFYRPSVTPVQGILAHTIKMYPIW